ncbi:MAG: hypothetical protein AAGM38_15840 [Pseudomonadota bacterium]
MDPDLIPPPDIGAAASAGAGAADGAQTSGPSTLPSVDAPQPSDPTLVDFLNNQLEGIERTEQTIEDTDTDLQRSLGSSEGADYASVVSTNPDAGDVSNSSQQSQFDERMDAQLKLYERSFDFAIEKEMALGALNQLSTTMNKILNLQ